MSTAVRDQRREFNKLFTFKGRRHVGGTKYDDYGSFRLGRPGPMDPIEGPGRTERRRAQRIDRREQAVSEMEGMMNIRRLEAGEMLPGLNTRWLRVNQVRSARDRRSASRVQLV